MRTLLASSMRVSLARWIYLVSHGQAWSCHKQGSCHRQARAAAGSAAAARAAIGTVKENQARVQVGRERPTSYMYMHMYMYMSYVEPCEKQNTEIGFHGN